MKLLTAFLFSTACLLSSWSQSETTPAYMQVGYYGRLSGGVLLGEYNTTSWQLSNGFRFNHLEIGMGLGLENLTNGRNVPLFGEVRYNFTKKSTQPFIGVMGGYLAPLNRLYPLKSAGGLTLGASVGLSHFFSSHFGVSWSLGYRLVDPVDYGIPFLPANKYQSDRIEVRMGIIFR